MSGAFELASAKVQGCLFEVGNKVSVPPMRTPIQVAVPDPVPVPDPTGVMFDVKLSIVAELTGV